MSGLAEEAIAAYKDNIRADLDPAADAKNKNLGNQELSLLARQYEYHTLRNEKLYSQMVFFQRVANLFFFFILLIAIALPFPNYDKVSKEYFFSILLMCLLFALVRFRMVLSAQVYLLNLFTYFDARAKGSVYHPYLVYGFLT